VYFKFCLPRVLTGASNRTTIHSIISRLGVDMLVGHMTRVREHDWFKSISPESMVLTSPSKVLPSTPSTEQEGEIWLDWSFIDFWKSNQRTMPDFSRYTTLI
jgi:intracellular protein transport protein USO1